MIDRVDCSLVALDYSQIELRMAAHLSQDPVLLSVYRQDGDIHMETACAMFGLPAESIDSKRHRRPAKTVNFGILYGMSPPTLLSKFYHEDIFEFTLDDCEHFMAAWKNKYAGYFEWVEDTMAYARRHGCIHNMYGRVRYVPEVYSSHRWIRERGLREAVNMPIQSAAADILKTAMQDSTEVYRAWQAAGYVVRPLLQVHDELVWEVEDAVLHLVIPMLEEAMLSAASQLTVPVKVDVKTGLNWMEMEPWECR